MPARMYLFRMNSAIASGAPLMSAEQSRDLTAALLPGITAEEVSDAFRANFDPSHATFIATLPEGGDVPTQAELVELGRKALDVEPEKPEVVARAEALLETLPETGELVDEEVHEASGVWSAWYGNGIRVHHLFHDARKNEVSVSIVLAGGEIEETAENRGVTLAGALAWQNAATSRLTSTQIRDLMTGRRVRVGGGAGEDTLTLTVSGDPADLESGMQLAHLLLTDPVVEAAALEQWRDRGRQQLQGRRLQPQSVLDDAMAETFYGGTAGMQPLGEEDLDRVTLEAAQRRIRALVKTAPIEVAVVGDIERERARQLVATYLGSLPARPRIGPDTLGALRDLPRPEGPITVRRTVETQTPQAYVLDGFFGADGTNLHDLRRLAVASRILSTRMTDVLREEKRLVYSIGAGSQPSEVYPGFGMFVAQAPTDPAKAEALGVAIQEMYEAFKADGPTSARRHPFHARGLPGDHREGGEGGLRALLRPPGPLPLRRRPRRAAGGRGGRRHRRRLSAATVPGAVGRSATRRKYAVR
ncbi:MAG: M16 family metallopeptidase [Planctomycetota bacterium]